MSEANPADRTPTFIFAGGGTGGHIFPALAIAEAITAHAPDARCIYLCSRRPLDTRILTAAGVEFHPLPAQPFAINPRGLLRFMNAWGPSVRTTRSILQTATNQAPTRLIAMGGFVCPPAVIAARAQRVPVTLINLDATPGRANRFVSRRADTVFTALPVPGRDWQTVGPIVRRDLTTPRNPIQARAAFGLHPDHKTLLITGGSQGAQTVGRFAVAVARNNPDAFNGWQVIHQAGVHDTDDDFAKDWNDLGVRAHVEPFIADMTSAWAASDLHLGRCGAGTVTECWATRTPAMFLPYPWHKDQHQRANAQALGDAAVIVKDHINPTTNSTYHGATLAELLADNAKRAHMARAFDTLGPSNGAKMIAQHLLESTASRRV